MSEDCKDCIGGKGMEANLKSVWTAINESKSQRLEHERRIGTLEQDYAVSKEKFDRIFESIDKIECSLQKICEAIEEIKTKNAKRYDNLVFEVMKYCVIAATAFACAKLF